jgi:hypothetical protein
MVARADAIDGHFNRDDLSHSKAEASEGFKVEKNFRDLLVSQARRWYDGFLWTFSVLWSRVVRSLYLDHGRETPIRTSSENVQ